MAGEEVKQRVARIQQIMIDFYSRLGKLRRKRRALLEEYARALEQRKIDRLKKELE